MAILKCKMCGGDLNVTEETKIIECEYCGTTQTVATSKDENLQSLFNRANILRMKSEFDKSEQLYEKIIEKDDTQAEAYWGLILCKYGIEYVEDPQSFKRVPTCHRTSFDSIIADEDYKSALKNADSVQRAVYEAEAKEIDRLQKEILALSQKEEPYDVFICYKETDNEGKRTQDSVIANDIYHQLTQEGLKVFYAAITLENKLGSAYEPCIFAALNSAKVMLVIGTKAEHFNAVWVKNEWSRFLKIIQKDRSKLLIPCYRDIDAYELPEEFAHLQAQDMSKIGFINDVVRGIKKVAADTPQTTAVVTETAPVVMNANIDSLLKRVFIFLEDGDWKNADEYAEKVLDINPECAEAYLGKLMAECKVKTQSGLKFCRDPFSRNSNYLKAIRYGGEELKKTLESYIDYINERNEKNRLSGIYSNAKRIMESATDEAKYKEAASLFESIAEYLDAGALAKECYEKAETARKDKILADGKSKMEITNIGHFQAAITLFETIPGWKDADGLISVCKQKIEELEAQAEADALVRKCQSKLAHEEKLKRAKQNKVKFAVAVLCVCVVVAGCMLFKSVALPNIRYSYAVSLMKKEDYTKAIQTFEMVKGYKDSDAQVKICLEKIKELKEKEVQNLIDQGDYEKALRLIRENSAGNPDNELLDRFVITYDRVIVDYGDGKMTTDYTFDEKGNCVGEKITYKDGRVYTSTYVYDDAGNLTRKIGKSDDSDELSVNGYEYDQNGNCIRETYTGPFSKEGKWEETTYDENGKAIITVSSKGTSTKYVYDENGYCIEEQYSIGTKRSFKYDERGNLIREAFVSEDGEEESVYSTTYDEFNKEIKYVSASSGGNVSTYDYTYDEYGNLKTAKAVFESGGYNATYTYEGMKISFK